MTKDEAMEQIRKLLNLSENEGATQAEAERAAMHAQRLLSKFQLSVADIERGEVGEELSKEEVELAGGKHHTWQYRLASAVSIPLDCECVFHKRWILGKPTTAVTFVGYDSDVRVARYLFVYLSRALHDMGTKEGKERGRAGAQLISYRGNFIVGAASSIRRRLMEEKAAMTSPPEKIEAALTAETPEQIAEASKPSAATALVLIKQPKVKAFFEQEYPNTETARTRGYSDQAAHFHGRQAGDKIPLRRGVEGSQPVGQLGVS